MVKDDVQLDVKNTRGLDLTSISTESALALTRYCCAEAVIFNQPCMNGARAFDDRFGNVSILESCRCCVIKAFSTGNRLRRCAYRMIL